MRFISLDALQNELVKPGFERELVPLVKYRGNLSLGRAQRVWNLVISMMMHEASSVTQGINHFQTDPQWSHLCYPEKPMVHLSMCTFLSRMLDNPKVTGLVPGLLEYVDWILPRYKRFHLQKIDYVPGEGGRQRRKKDGRAPEKGINWPFLIHDGGRPEHELLKLVNAAVPRGYSPDMRADMCQDLVMGVLSGEFDKDDLHLPIKEVRRRLRTIYPSKYVETSLDVRLYGDSRFTRMDRLADEEGREWAA